MKLFKDIWQYFEEFLVEGKLPDFPKEKWNDQILISEYLANRLQFKVGDKFNTYFLKEDTSRPPNIVTFEIVGIYNSGFQELDEKFCIADLRHIQRLNKWEDDQIGNFEVFENVIKFYSKSKNKLARSLSNFSNFTIRLNEIDFRGQT